MRIFISGIIQETNTFSPVPTDIILFQRGYLLEGECIKNRLSGTNTEITGFFDYFSGRADVELIPGIAAWAVASGRITAETKNCLENKLLSELKQALPVDGVLLALHGSMVGDDEDDCDGYFLEKIREVVGQDTPIVGTLDYHANLTARMVDNSDLLIGYRTYPHEDFMETGQKAAKAMETLILENPYISHVFEKLPMILPVENTGTSAGPIFEVMNHLKAIDADPDLLSASFFCPQPWLDVDSNGISIIIYFIGGKGDFFRHAANNILSYVWNRREEFFFKVPGIDDFLEKIEQFAKPVALVDSGDIISAGGTGDSTEVLRKLLDQGIKCKTVLTVVDAKTVAQAVSKGEGCETLFDIGTGSYGEYNQTVTVHAKVKKILDEPVKIKGASFSGLSVYHGKRVLLVVDEWISIIVTEFGSLVHDPEFLRSMGIEPKDMDFIVQKTHKLFIPAYKDIIKSIVVLDTPGCTDRNIGRLDFKKLKDKVFPLSEILIEIK